MSEDREIEILKNRVSRLEDELKELRERDSKQQVQINKLIRRSYTNPTIPPFKLMRLRMKGMTIKEMAEVCGCSESTIKRRLKELK